MINYGFIPSGENPLDKEFKTNLLLAIPKEYKLAKIPPVCDLGNKPICCAISISEIINWLELARTGKKINVDPDKIFDLRLPKSLQGMIPRGALTMMKNVGVDNIKISGFFRTYTVDSTKLAIITNGPVLIGVNVYNSDTEFWKGVSKPIGGHAVILTGWNKDGFILQNSWGFSYGNRGTAILPFRDWDKVLECWGIEI